MHLYWSLQDYIGNLIARDYNFQDGKVVFEPLNAPGENDLQLADYGIDKLGSMVWAFQKLSPNFGYYGNLHNSGHILIGYSHDPAGQYYKQVLSFSIVIDSLMSMTLAFVHVLCFQSLGGVMAMPSTAPRDPAFYRWHAFIDDIFQRYKATLPEYNVE